MESESTFIPILQVWKVRHRAGECLARDHTAPGRAESSSGFTLWGGGPCGASCTSGVMPIPIPSHPCCAPQGLWPYRGPFADPSQCLCCRNVKHLIPQRFLLQDSSLPCWDIGVGLLSSLGRVSFHPLGLWVAPHFYFLHTLQSQLSRQWLMLSRTSPWQQSIWHSLIFKGFTLPHEQGFLLKDVCCVLHGFNGGFEPWMGSLNLGISFYSKDFWGNSSRVLLPPDDVVASDNWEGFLSCISVQGW